MLASSAFVLTALTMTGIYMQAGDEKSQDDGYTLDFTAIEDNIEDKNREIARNTPVLENGEGTGGESFNPDDDLDYMPLEAGSGNIEIPGVTTVLGEESMPGREDLKPEAPKKEESSEPEKPEPVETKEPRAGAEQPGEQPDGQAATEPANTEPVIPDQIIPEQAEAEQAAVETGGPELHFAESDGLLRPLEGEVLIPFNMSGSEYFSTLREYKYNPALILAAEEGTSVFACAAGKVVDIYQDSEIGQAVTVELGDGYRITYGQLKGLNVALNSYINPGDMIASVAAPTKYYCMEGSNLYLELSLNGEPVDPEVLFR